jgi:phenylpyruvate tautomerase PptA (4-oxalocrotonate tautomerase family)
MSAANDPPGRPSPDDDPLDEQYKGHVNAQVIAAVTETAATLLASAPGATQAALDQVAAQCAGLSMLNAVQAQQNANMIAGAVVTQAASRILRARAARRPDRSEDAASD